jgi:hypothetical protein
LFFAVTTPFTLVVFELRWWVAVLLGSAIFVGWVILGILLQVAYGGSEEEKPKSGSKEMPVDKT